MTSATRIHPALRDELTIHQIARQDPRTGVRSHFDGTLFSDDAIALIHTTSRGYPRAVDNLAIASLLAAYAAGKAIVDESSARTAVTEVTTE